MIYPQKSVVPIMFLSSKLEYQMNNPPEFNEDNIDKLEGEEFTDLYYPQDPNIIPGRYKISNKGRVYDVFTESFLTLPYSGVYQYCSLATVNNMSKVEYNKYRLNRVVKSSFDHNPDMCSLVVHHKNNIPSDNSLENLDWATNEENLLYAIQDGRTHLISNPQQLSDRLIEDVCLYIKEGNSPEEAGVKFNMHEKLVYQLVCGEVFPEAREKYQLPEFTNKYNLKTVRAPLPDVVVSYIKQDIRDGLPEIEIIRKYQVPRHVVSDIRHGKTYTHVDRDQELPEIQKLDYMSPEKADEIGKMFAEGKSLKEVSEISGFENHMLLDIKRGTKFPEVKQKYNLIDVKEYNGVLDDDIILNHVIPRMLSKEYTCDQDIADIFGCSSAQIRDLRLHRRRTYLTDGIDFTDCYRKSDGKKTHVLTNPEVAYMCKFIQDNPHMPYDKMVDMLKKDIPNITCKLCQDIKLRKTHRDISDYYVW